MIRVNLDYMPIKRDKILTELAKAINLTLPNLSILKTNKAQAIRFSTLEAICEELDCQPGDLLEYIADDENNLEEIKNFYQSIHKSF